MAFAKTLTSWYIKNKRELPWRNTRDPYLIWLSEILLQQTRVAQGLPYYLKFKNAFPTIHDLAEAPLEKVLKLWQGLGYYSRARNLHETAVYVSRELKGKFPPTYKELIKLKGVGDYTASAIASTCYSEPVAAVDGNVYRVLSRYFDIDTPVNSSAGMKEFKDLSQELLGDEDPWTYNQGIMEFGATHCKPQNPYCDSCPLSASCLALKNKKVNVLPVKIKKGKIKDRYFNYIVFRTGDNTTLLEQRKGKGIWEGMYQFPLVETETSISPGEFPHLQKFKKLIGEEFSGITLYNEIPIIHKLTHQHIHTRFWIVDKQELGKKPIAVKKVKDYPVPVLIANFLNEYDFGHS